MVVILSAVWLLTFLLLNHMDDRRDLQYAMTTVLVKFIADHLAAIKVSPVAEAEAADVQAAYNALKARVGTAPLSTLLNTTTSKEARRVLLQLLPVVQGPLRSLATKAKNTDLLARATLSSRQLRAMKPEELRDVSAALFDAADAQLPALANYALTAPVLAQLRAKHQEFAGTVRTTGGLIDQRSTANQTVDDLLTALMQQVYELDKPMEVFRLLNEELHAGYKKARRVGRNGGGKAPVATSPAPTA